MSAVDVIAAFLGGLACIWLSCSSRLSPMLKTIALSMGIVTIGGILAAILAGRVT